MIHREPLLGNFQVQLGISQSALLEAVPQVGCAVSLNVVKYRLGNKAAAVALGCHPVKHLNRGFWKHDVDAFAHKRDSRLIIQVYL
ncbi:MAG: hypothetical protein DMG16_22800 [Acidobacteria bacterium]|nr:MAG: hypothetical protein DMG16_22800 [Acidobacteriota bacterium]